MIMYCHTELIVNNLRSVDLNPFEHVWDGQERHCTAQPHSQDPTGVKSHAYERMGFAATSIYCDPHKQYESSCEACITLHGSQTSY